MRSPRALGILTASLGLLVACSPSRKELQADLDQTRAALEQAQQQQLTLEQKLVQLEQEIADRGRMIAQLETDKATLSQELDELRDEQRRRREELATYQQLFDRLRALIDAGTIQVSFRKGRMIVELPSAVLFDSGRTELKPDGKAALEKLVEALASVSHRDLAIAGHTDNVPINTRRYKSNWELSTQRAVVVVSFMIEKGFPADHLAAAGYGEEDPIADNTTEEGKAKNRRIEIQLMPDLGELQGIEDMVAKGKPPVASK
jgi:chemotaxis protein MotB